MLKQLSVDESKYRVGKTLLFLQNYEIIDQLDKVLRPKAQPSVCEFRGFKFRVLLDH